MYCKICGTNKQGIKLLSQEICDECIDEIENITVFDQDYDKYKNIIRILLGYYISEQHYLNPVN